LWRATDVRVRWSAPSPSMTAFKFLSTKRYKLGVETVSGTTSLHPCVTSCWHALLAADMLIYVDYSSKRRRHKQSKKDDVFKKVSQALLDQVNQQNSRSKTLRIRSKTLISNQGLTIVRFPNFYIYISPRTSNSHLSHTFVSKLVHIHCPLVLLSDCNS
jgi:hypothetical protein